MFNPLFSSLNLCFVQEEKPSIAGGELSHDLVKYKSYIKEAWSYLQCK